MENTDQAREELRSFYKFVLHMIDFQEFVMSKQKDMPTAIIKDFKLYNQSLEMAKKMANLLLESVDLHEELNKQH